VVGTFLAASERVRPELVEHARAALEGVPHAGLCSVSVRGEVAVARYLGSSGEEARSCFQQVWSVFREHLFGKSIAAPRIWAT
jgi:urease accessory protein UreH